MLAFSRPVGSARRPPPGVWPVALLLAGVIFGLLLCENRHYLFETALHENTDQAADSLLVREAKHTLLLHGHYSQWRFYHPGPALLDALAAGEALFHDRLGLVPTPYNGQLLALSLVTALFLALALAICAGRLGGGGGGHRFFLPLALGFAAWHYGAVGGQVFLDAWPAYPPVLALLCFLVAAASTASGEGRELPVVAAAGGWLVHNHVAQPLFVGPLGLLAYAGLWAACRRREPYGGPDRPPVPWREFPRAHLAAAVLLTLFVLPLFLDALDGGGSNLARILAFLRAHPSPGNKFARSFCYLLTFGGYAPYQPGTREFARYSAAGMLAFAGLHWRAFACWLVAGVGAPALLLAAARHRQSRGLPAPRGGRGTFLRWFYAVWAAACGLTLVWGMRQNGPMYYYNAFFDYSLYFCLALGFAAALSAALMAWTAPAAARGWRPVAAVLLWLGAAGSVAVNAGRFRVTAFGTPADAAMARTVARATTPLPTDAVIFLDCRPWENWPVAAAVALELARLGRDVRVNDNWAILFGDALTVRHAALPPARPLARWLVVSGDEPAAPLLGCHLETRPPPDLDPQEEQIRFSRDGNFDAFAVFGWSLTDGDWTWSDQRAALLRFRPRPLPADAAGVDVLVSAWATPPPGRAELARLVVRWGNEPLGTFRLPPPGPELVQTRVRISAAQWRDAAARSEARLWCEFPDAVSPASLGPGDDRRLLGGGFRIIDFRLAPPR